ncbi:MAG: glycosyltransferase family 2 protein [Candidatus Aenigmarchaeota archaeon]|nr:glycosyltransferase family 2 protein [Candidatus Aenigmarchaeota archaeon]
MKKILALIPAYNEEKNIATVIKLCKKAGAIPVVIDDGSKDKTALIAKKNGATVLRHKKNMGKGYAIKTGFDYASKMKNIVCVVAIDADMQYDPLEIPKVCKPILENKADFVIGERNWGKIPFRHALGNFVWRKTFNLLFRTNLKDTNCGFQAFSMKAVKTLKKYVYGGYIVETALLINAIRNSLRIVNVPVSVRYKERSRILRGIRMVLGVWLYMVTEGIKFWISKL